MKRLELVLTTCLVLLKLSVLYNAWGHIQGFDANPWLDVFRATHWFEPLPSPKALFASYHPPLSYLLGRWIYAIYPHELETSQILSTFAILGAVFALRSTLRTIGLLWTLPGLTMLYVAASLPLIVWLAIETSCDALLFMWFVVILALSTKLFWSSTPAEFWRSPRYVLCLVCLGLASAAGLLTKFSAAFALQIPFLVILARRGMRRPVREIGAAVFSVALGAILVAPLYYTRYYKPLGHVFPVAMEWARKDDLRVALQLRDSHPWAFLWHMVRIPAQNITGTQTPVPDSFINSIWLQTWKRDIGLGLQGRLSLAMSDLYVHGFAVIALLSIPLLMFKRLPLQKRWRSLGWVLFPLSVTLTLAMLYFGWQYPLWDWEVFKAKYMTPAMLWIPYSAALLVTRSTSLSAVFPSWERFATDAVLLLVVVFMFLNHLLPVY